jgi:hypothetical protein
MVEDPMVAPEPSIKGQPATVSAAFVADAEFGAPTCVVDHGDGSAVEPGTVASEGEDWTCTGPAHGYADIGTYEVTVTVHDWMGQTASASSDHVVIYPFSGGPWLPGDRTRIKAGSTLPVAFSLGADEGMGVLVSATFSIGGGASKAASGQLVYDPYTMKYQYLWKTPKKPTGTAILTLTLDDGTPHEVTVTLF